MDPATIAAMTATAASAFGDLVSTTKNILNLTQDAKVKAAIGDLQSKLLDSQSAYLDLLGKNQLLLAEKTELQEKLRKAEKFKADAERYKLITPAPGFSAYALKSDRADGEPPHWLCANCLASGVKSFLQLSDNNSFERQFFDQSTMHITCATCKATFEIPVAAFNAAWGKYA